MKKLVLILMLLTINSFSQITNNLTVVDLKNEFGTFEGGFSLYNFEKDTYIQYNTDQCNKRFSPCSTFKIPNSLIGLESGIITDTSFVIKYDSTLHPKDNDMLNNEPYKYWFQDLSMKRAFKYSCVWYYQELARRIGKGKMNKYVKLINYGNNDITSGIDNFWLCGSVNISINEQIEFLKKFYTNNLTGFSSKNIKAVKDIMLYESNEYYKLYGKTGSGDCINNKAIGWYVGFVETNSGTYAFAMNIIVNSFADFNNNYRIELTKKILKKLKVIDC